MSGLKGANHWKTGPLLVHDNKRMIAAVHFGAI
jgi:hypothetical protein